MVVPTFPVPASGGSAQAGQLEIHRAPVIVGNPHSGTSLNTAGGVWRSPNSPRVTRCPAGV